MINLVKYTIAIIFAIATKTIAQVEHTTNHFLRRESNDKNAHRELNWPCRDEKFVPCDPGTGDFGFQICHPMGPDGETAQLNRCVTTGVGGIGFTLGRKDYCGCCYAVCPDTSACTCPCINNRGQEGIRMVEKNNVENFPNRDLSFCAAGSAELEGVKMSLAQILINLGSGGYTYKCVPAGDERCPIGDEREYEERPTESNIP
jgi:hypothetical protein